MTPALLTLACTLAMAGPNVVEIVFLPEAAELPPLVAQVAHDGASRTVSWVIPGEQPASGRLVDQKGAARSLLALPQAPAGAALRDDGAVLVLSIDNAGDWARRYQAATPAGARSRVAGVSVDGERALRLVVPALGAPPGPATLVGAGVRVAGRGVSRTAGQGARALLRAGAELLTATPLPIDAIAACGGQVAVSYSSDQPPMRLLAVGSPTCAGALAAVRVSGVRLSGVRSGPARDVPVAGVVVLPAP